MQHCNEFKAKQPKEKRLGGMRLRSPGRAARPASPPEPSLLSLGFPFRVSVSLAYLFYYYSSFINLLLFSFFFFFF